MFFKRWEKKKKVENVKEKCNNNYQLRLAHIVSYSFGDQNQHTRKGRKQQFSQSSFLVPTCFKDCSIKKQSGTYN